ncbi:MAG: amidohydrolase family protein [Hyphomicrobiaceae bacterium]
MLAGRTSTSLYVGPYLRPMGIIGLNYVEGDLRSYSHVPITAWLDFADKHPGLIRYLKVGAFEKGGPAPLHLAKGVAEMLGVPMYLHVGELTPEDGLVPTYDAFRIAQSGDIITHIYNGNIGNILDANGQVLDIVRDAQARGVIFDIGFGGYNFAWEIAEKGFEQGLKPDIISSDLQQFNIGGPVYSLAHVLGFFLHLGMSISDVIRCITMAPARSLRLADRAGSLRRGMPADITVFRVEEGSFDLLDAFQSSRTTSRRFVPQMVFKDGRRFECDFERALNERNWFPIVCEDHVPAQAAQLSSEQLEFLHALAASLAEMEWQPSLPAEIDLQMATQLQDAFHDAMAGRSISLRDALGAVYDCFIEEPFTVQIGLFLLRLERSFVLQRIENVSSTFKAVA